MIENVELRIKNIRLKLVEQACKPVSSHLISSQRDPYGKEIPLEKRSSK